MKDETVNENRLLALTYLTSSVDNDTFQKDAILKEVGQEALLTEITEIAIILAATLGRTIDEIKPIPLQQVLDDLRTIVREN